MFLFKLSAYLASCGNTSCDQFDAINAQWFKVYQVGQKPDGSGTWFMADIGSLLSEEVSLLFADYAR